MFSKKMIMAILTFGMLALVASAGTYAYFSSSVSSDNNKITAGVIKLTPGGAVAAVPFDLKYIVPGQGVTDYNAGTLKNDGNVAGDLDGKITLRAIDATSKEDVALPPEFSMSVKVVASQGTQTVNLAKGVNTLTPTIKLGAGETATIYVTYNFADTNAEDQIGQNVQFGYDARFVLKSNKDYTPY
jgi:predicted ribosomally synthesized peptide with SipW-like signal peptide